MANNQIDKLSGELLKHRQTISRFRRILESLPDGVICTDIDRRICLINSAAEQLLGYSEKELLSSRTNRLYLNRADYEKIGMEGLGDCNTRRRRNSFEVLLKKKNGTLFPAETVATVIEDENGEVICLLELFRDISERKQLENSLRQLEVEFRTVANFTYDWECWTRPNGSMRYVSPSCLRLTGYPVEDFLEDPSLFRNIIHPEDQPVWDDHFREAKARSGLREVQFRIIRADGMVRWIEHACQPVIDESGTLQGYRSSNRDITRRKNYEQELYHALSEIEQYQEQLEAEGAYLREEIKATLNYDKIIGSSNALQYVFFKIEQIRNSDTTVILLGETGTGKELFARAIHTTSTRKDQPIVKVNCASLQPSLIESELFGHEKGAFTGAERKHIGRFELADKGTMFLDEIGELPFDLQPKLLRVLQDGEFVRVGGTRTVRVDTRIIAATNRDLYQDVSDGLFRKDLWYRLNVFPITVPPLRDRMEDIPQLVKYFVETFASSQGKNITTIPDRVMARLQNYPWPGNIRELENVIERAVINTSGTTLALADELKHPTTHTTVPFKSLAAMERDYIIDVLEKTSWKVSGKNSAAEILGLKRSTLRAKMDKHNIRRP